MFEKEFLVIDSLLVNCGFVRFGVLSVMMKLLYLSEEEVVRFVVFFGIGVFRYEIDSNWVDEIFNDIIGNFKVEEFLMIRVLMCNEYIFDDILIDFICKDGLFL